jgi:hypothetical protein
MGKRPARPFNAPVPSMPPGVDWGSLPTLELNYILDGG